MNMLNKIHINPLIYSIALFYNVVKYLSIENSEFLCTRTVFAVGKSY